MAIIPDEIYKRKHFGTPESISLIVINYIVTIVAVQVFATCTHINVWFWAIMGGLAIYNVIQIRKNPDTFDRKNMIIFIGSLVLLLGVFFLLRIKAQPC